MSPAVARTVTGLALAALATGALAFTAFTGFAAAAGILAFAALAAGALALTAFTGFAAGAAIIMMLAAAAGALPAVHGTGVAVDVGADKIITHRTGHPSYGNFAGNACTDRLCRRCARVRPARKNPPEKQENHARWANSSGMITKERD